jgi:hypothetical protein
MVRSVRAQSGILQPAFQLPDAGIGHFELAAPFHQEEFELADALLQVLADGATAGFAGGDIF